jgi:hypothetical protein
MKIDNFFAELNRQNRLQENQCQKGIKRGSVTLQKRVNRIRFFSAFELNVKKVRIPRLQGLDPGEMTFFVFPFRLKKSRK